MTHDFDIVISGRSFVANAQALAFAHVLGSSYRIALLDHRPEGVDKEPVSAPDTLPVGGRAFAISCASQKLLETLGVWQHVEEMAQPIREISLTDSALDDAVRPEVMTYDNSLDDGAPASFIVQSDRLEAALNLKVKQTPSIKVLYDAKAVQLETNSAKAFVEFANGEKINAALVIAADGRKSHLRSLAGIKITSWPHNQIGIVTQVKHARPHEGRAIQHFLPSGPFAILPLPNHHSCITWSENADVACTILQMDDAAFLDEVLRRFGNKLGDIELVGPRQSWPLETHIAQSFVADRFALVGDAARGVHPIAGQGLNLGLRDVAALTEVVADVVRVGFDAGNAEALQRYERWRRFDSVVSSFTFDGLNRIFSSDGAVARGLRDAGLGILDRVPWIKQQFVKQAAGMSGEVPKLLKGERV